MFSYVFWYTRIDEYCIQRLVHEILDRYFRGGGRDYLGDTLGGFQRKNERKVEGNYIRKKDIESMIKWYYNKSIQRPGCMGGGFVFTTISDSSCQTIVDGKKNPPGGFLAITRYHSVGEVPG